MRAPPTPPMEARPAQPPRVPIPPTQVSGPYPGQRTEQPEAETAGVASLWGGHRLGLGSCLHWVPLYGRLPGGART